MEGQSIYDLLRGKALTMLKEIDALDREVRVKASILTPEEAIGRPGRSDFPLLKGKERLVQANFIGAVGQAYTDSPSNYLGPVQEALQSGLQDNYERAIFIATLNAIARCCGLVSNTVHCKDNGPADCAERVVEFIRAEYGSRPKLAIVGFQPALVEKCVSAFPTRVLDLDEDNVFRMKFGVLIEDGRKSAGDVADWCDVALVTGTVIVNGTAGPWLDLDKPVVFYGTTISGAAALMGLKRFCPCST